MNFAGLIQRVAAWIAAPWLHRRSREKRRLETICREAGLSQSRARLIAVRFFAGDLK